MATSRVTVLLLMAGAVALALLGSQEIFSSVLFAWTAMGAAFGPLLIVRTVLGRRLSPGRTFATMLTGFAVAVGSHVAYDMNWLGTTDYKGFANYVLPFIAAFTVCLWPSRDGG